MRAIKPIRTVRDHEDALAEIARLLESAKKGTADGDRLEVLLTLAHEYESRSIPLPPLDPIEAIVFRLDQLGLKRKDLAHIFKTSGRTSEVMERKRALSLAMIRGLHATLKIPLAALVQEYDVEETRPTRARRRAPKTRLTKERARSRVRRPSPTS
jgi:HTH-type transcriptional regulator/antitoxin HigA